MLYPKFTQRYLAAIVCCFILVLGISMLFFVYGFYFCRSPLLVENIKSISQNVYNGQLKANLHLNTESHSQFDSENDFTTIKNAVNSKYDNSKMRKNAVNNDKANSNQLNQSDTHLWKSKTNDSDANENILFDTIDIDDYERSKANFSTKDTFENKNSRKVGFTPIPYRKLDMKPMRGDHVQKSFAINVKTHHQREHESNLDAVYDKNHDSNESFDLTENDEDVDDDFITYGSGSGNYELTAYSEEDHLFQYDMPIVTTFSKDWPNHRKAMSFTSSKQKGNREIKTKQIKGLKSLLGNNKEKKIKNKLMVEGPQSPDLFVLEPDHSSLEYLTKLPKYNKRRLATRLKNSPATSVLLHESPEFIDDTTKEKTKLNYNKNENNIYNKRAKNKELIVRTTTSKQQQKEISSEFSDHKLLESDGRSTDRNNEISSKYSGRIDGYPKDFQMNPTNWIETRARRILGNVRKSEERSRQLLLCEEAGGGELCRMLFKGHSLTSDVD